LSDPRLYSIARARFLARRRRSCHPTAGAPARIWVRRNRRVIQTIGALRAETWEAVNQALLVSAKQDRLESGATVRPDGTVSAAMMHEPSDSTLLWDTVRVTWRACFSSSLSGGSPGTSADGDGDGLRRAGAAVWLEQANQLLARRHRLAVEDPALALGYGELIAAARASRGELQTLAAELAEIAGTAAERWRAQVDHYLPADRTHHRDARLAGARCRADCAQNSEQRRVATAADP
jgi:IS5 family transposase